MRIFVALHLQRSKVEQAWRSLSSLFLCHRRDFKRQLCHHIYGALPVSFLLEAVAGIGEVGVVVEGVKLPGVFGYELGYFFLSLYDKGESRSLHTTYR